LTQITSLCIGNINRTYRWSSIQQFTESLLLNQRIFKLEIKATPYERTAPVDSTRVTDVMANTRRVIGVARRLCQPLSLHNDVL